MDSSVHEWRIPQKPEYKKANILVPIKNTAGAYVDIVVKTTFVPIS